jgi:hypothetical protein
VDCRLSHCRPARHCESVPRRPPFVNHSDRLRSSPTSYNRFISLWHIQKRHPLRDETSTDETTPKPDRPRPHLGRNRVLAYGPVTFPHSGVSRMSASVRLMIQGHSARRASSRVRQCHLLIKISEIKSETYTQKPVYTRGGTYTHPLCIRTTARVNAPTRVYAPGCVYAPAA